MSVRILPMGERAFLLESGSLDEVLAVHRALVASRPAGVTDLVPAARTVLVRVDPRVLALSAARSWAQAAASDPPEEARVHAQPLVELDIAYDGADLDDTAALLGMTPAELVARHAAAAWTVAFTGFAPGFGYLVSDAWPFDVPRLDAPRTRVPAGAVGLAGAFAGAYPRETPGGWRLIGTTTAVLFDPDAASPALLAPGTRVRFRPTSAHAGAPERGSVPASSSRRGRSAEGRGQAAAGSVPVGSSEPPRLDAEARDATARGDAADDAATGGPGNRGAARLEAAAGGAGARETAAGGAAPARSPEPPRFDAGACDATPRGAGAAPGIRILEPGLLATVQDLGREGAASVGVAVSGALDRTALRTANRLVGNVEGAAGVEVTMGGLRAVADADTWFAVTGAWGPVRLNGHDVDPYTAHAWPAGAEVRLDWFAHGARAYLAVRGGVDARPVLGSRATDLLAGLGPEVLRTGDILALASDIAGPPPASDLAPWGAPHDDELELELAPGPRADWFTPGALAALYEQVWTMTNAADRVGARLDGPVLARIRPGELPSEGMVPGALQVPPSGRPTILLADGPVTGGYPVIAVVRDAALDLVAQARPGTRIRFRHARPAP